MSKIDISTLTLKIVGTGLLAACVGIAGACQTNEMSQYKSKVEVIEVFTPGGPALLVNLGSTTQKNKLGAAFTSGKNSMVWMALADRMKEVVPKKRVNDMFADVFLGDTSSLKMNLQRIDDEETELPNADARMELKIESYGFQSASAEAPVTVFVQARAKMIYLENNKVIWEKGAAVRDELEKAATKIPSASVTINGKKTDFFPEKDKLRAAYGNMAALENLGDKDLGALFDAFTYQVATDLAQQFVEDTTAPAG